LFDAKVKYERNVPEDVRIALRDNDGPTPTALPFADTTIEDEDSQTVAFTVNHVPARADSLKTRSLEMERTRESLT
jgi:hypothetical protein